MFSSFVKSVANTDLLLLTRSERSSSPISSWSTKLRRKHTEIKKKRSLKQCTVPANIMSSQERQYQTSNSDRQLTLKTYSFLFIICIVLTSLISEMEVGEGTLESEENEKFDFTSTCALWYVDMTNQMVGQTTGLKLQFIRTLTLKACVYYAKCSDSSVTTKGAGTYNSI